jgi:hypothetical protein
MEKIVIRPFGPSILKVKMSDDIVKILNNYTEKKSKENLDEQNLNAGDKLAGNVSQEITIENDFIKTSGFGNFLMKETANWIFSSTKKKKQIKNFRLIGSWIVRQFKNEFNPLHTHAGHVSGVGYLKVPTNLGNTVQKNKPNINGHLQLVHGTKNFLSESVLDIKPEVGDFYFFPHYVMHTVYPFVDTFEERRSVSFNAFIDPEIFSSVD